MVRDLAYGRGVVALFGEDLGGGVEEFATTRGAAALIWGFFLVGLVGTESLSSYACWLLTATTSPVMYEE